MDMDLSPVNVGDTVYDMQYGPGTVAEVLTSVFIVSYPQGTVTGRRYTYNGLGIMNGRQFRTLFWQPPIIATPFKNEADWVRIQAICSAVVAAFRP